jgi:hypothetical protein
LVRTTAGSFGALLEGLQAFYEQRDIFEKQLRASRFTAEYKKTTTAI